MVKGVDMIVLCGVDFVVSERIVKVVNDLDVFIVVFINFIGSNLIGEFKGLVIYIG